MTFESFISNFQKVTKTANGVMVRCPGHDDGSASLSIGKSNDGGVLLKCFAGCPSTQIVSALGLKMSDLFVGSTAKKFTPPAPAKPESKPESTEPAVIEREYSYRDITGKEVYQALRMKPKSFRQRHRSETNSSWVWTMEGVTRVLYRLPEILAAQTVWICEGEKDVENLVKLGFEATCNVGGAGKWLDAYTESLAGKDVVLCGDNDAPGQKHIELVFASIAGTAKTVRIVKLPESIKDASDYIATFRTAEEAREALAGLCSAAAPHLKGFSLPLYTLGEMEDDYRRFVRSMETNSFSLGKWLPTLKKIRPLVPGELAFVIGDTGTGKTGILQHIASAALPLPTLMFQLELPRELMFERFAAQIMDMTCANVEEAYKSWDESIAKPLDAKTHGLLVCSESRLTVQQIETFILRAELKLGERPRVVLIDYVQLIGGKGPNRREKISDIAEDLKVLAKSTRTIVIVASQIARNKEESKPGLHSAKESGSIESSCGLLIGAWRDDEDAGLLHVEVLKSTKGGAGTHVYCNFDGAGMRITERAAIEKNDIPTND